MDTSFRRMSNRSHAIAINAVVLSWVVVPTLVFPIGAANAQEENARDLFTRGQAAYAQGDYESAVSSWSRAYELDPRPLLQYNLSQAYERLGRVPEAIAALQLYLDNADAADPHQADARARQASMRERLGRTGIQIRGGPEGAAILVDGEDAGRAPRPDPIRVDPGSHQVVMRLAGYQDFTSSVVVPAGQVAEVVVQMSALSGEGSRPSPHPADGSSAGGDELPIGPIILFSAAGVTLITAAVLGGVAYGEASSTAAGTSQADTARTLAISADVFFGISAACAIGAVAWVFFGMGSDDDDQTAVVLPYVTGESAGVVSHLSF